MSAKETNRKNAVPPHWPTKPSQLTIASNEAKPKKVLKIHMEIRPICWEETIPIRQRVLWPNKPPEYCHLEGDPDASHFGAFIQGQLVCVASIYFNSNKARLRKFATLEEYQGQGVGTQMLHFILQSLRKTGIKIFWCDARETALTFYRRFDMQPIGERFYKADVPYFKLQVTL